MKEKTTFQRQMPEQSRGFVYMLSGQVTINDETVSNGEAMLMDTSTQLSIHALKESQLILCFGKPHNEPIFQHGSYVD
jgi:redox-sensitive bicupin YhaK (pirin superfamily)